MGSTTRSFIALLPVTTLTLLQFSSGKAIRFVAFFSALPVLFGLIYQLGNVEDAPETFIADMMVNTVFGTLLPIATLILATSAFRDEIEDRTMVYLVLKPVARFRIVAEKYLAVTASAILALWMGAIATWVVASGGSMPDTVTVLVASIVAILAGVVGYAALFIAISLIVPRALIVGILYTLIWETLLSRLIPGVWVLSVRHYVVSIFYRLNDGLGSSVDNPVQLYAGFLAIIVIALASLGLATLRLRTMDFE